MEPRLFRIEQLATEVTTEDDGSVVIIQYKYPEDEPQQILIDQVFLPTFIDWLRQCVKSPEAKS